VIHTFGRFSSRDNPASQRARANEAETKSPPAQQISISPAAPANIDIIAKQREVYPIIVPIIDFTFAIGSLFRQVTETACG
jgi:hypothetical protein